MVLALYKKNETPAYRDEPGYCPKFNPGRMDARFLVTMEIDQREAIDREAAKRGLSRTEFVRLALWHYMSCKVNMEF